MTTESTDASGASRRNQLVAVKLRALVGDHLATDTVEVAAPIGVGAALMHDGVAWVYLDDKPGSRLGAALVWAERAGAAAVQIIAEADTGILARRATAFRRPIEVWHAEGRTLLPAVGEPILEPRSAPEEHDSFRELITQGGATPMVEHGVLVGEVNGLEVCRVVDDPHLHVSRLEVGVGAHDREAFQMLHGDRPAVESLARIVDAVRSHRQPGARQHPLNQLGAERLLRWRIEQQPELVGATDVTPMNPPVARPNLKDPMPCAAIGVDDHGVQFVVAFSTGVDLDLVPFGADARIAASELLADIASDCRLVLVTPSRDRVPAADLLAGMLLHPGEFVSLD
ncbi:MAG TPA: hypothetical protein VMM60_18175 [Ilumatobacter sp.]|nr:hypothetical protein [Ilumatobacter sp.]